MLIGEIIKGKNPDIHNKLKKSSATKIKYDERLSFSDIESLMRNRSYKRSKSGALQQTRF